jgi:hypothetical protein
LPSTAAAIEELAGTPVKVFRDHAGLSPGEKLIAYIAHAFSLEQLIGA